MEKKLKEALGLNDAKTKSAYEKLKEEVEMLDMQKRYNDHKKDNSLQTRANNTNLKKQMLENEKRIKELEKEAKAKPDKTAEKLSKLKREKDQYEMQRQIEALEKLKANNWKDPKKDKDNK